MKEKPIIFKTEMVRVILCGRKMQTRRVIKPQPQIPVSEAGCHPWKLVEFTDGTWDWYSVICGDYGEIIKCPYTADRLWVRETWADVNTPDGPAICYRADGSYMSWRDFSTKFGADYGDGPSMDYNAYPGDYVMWWEDLLSRDIHGEGGYRWKPSIHMPRWASRINLAIKNIRVERVQDISEEDAVKEGVTTLSGHEGAHPIQTFKYLWDTINKKRGYGWDNNPYVWVIEFYTLIGGRECEQNNFRNTMAL